MRVAFIAAAALAALPLAGTARADGDAAAGKTKFAQCALCHSPAPGRNMVGPSLFGVVGRQAASAPNFSYSPAMKNSGKTWNVATLDAYLADPRGQVPGTKMIFAGLKSAEDRANVIAYLATLK
jgi:cytochrome c